MNDISDRRSGNQGRGRPTASRTAILRVANQVLAEANRPAEVTMEQLAAACGVGKGTLFRAFGSRDGLLDALWSVPLATIRDSLAGGTGPLGADGSPRKRAVAFVDALLLAKLDHRHLLAAREVKSGLLQSPNYLWMLDSLVMLLGHAAPRAARWEATYAAHVLLAALHIDLIDALLGAGMTREAIRAAQARHVRTVIADLRDD